MSYAPQPLNESDLLLGEARGAPLSWRAWLLVPLVAVGAFGMAIPVLKLGQITSPLDVTIDKVAKRYVKYDSTELETLLSGSVPVGVIKAGDGLLRQAEKESKKHAGKITIKLANRIEAFLGNYR